MRLTRRSTAAFFAASVLTLAACGSDTSPVTPEASPVVNPGNLEMTLSQSSLSFMYNTATQQVTPLGSGDNSIVVGGVIALASIAQVGEASYTPPNTQRWLSVERKVDAQAGGWRLTMRPQGAHLAPGAYTAFLPITVPGARNNPQIVTVNFVVCNTMNCLAAGSTLDGALTGTDASWTLDLALNESGPWFYDDYNLYVAPGQSVTLEMWGSSCGKPYTHDDVFLVVFLSGSYYTYNDDACGLNSLVHITNGMPAGQLYQVRATSYSGGSQGTYHLKVRDGLHGTSIRTDDSLPIDQFSAEYRAAKALRTNN